MNEPKPPGSRATVAAVAVLAVAAVAVVLLLMATRPQPVQITIVPPAPSATPPATGTPGPVTVYVTGAVARPDILHSLPPDSRVQDAVAAAGGVLGAADLSRVNLAARLRDGDHVHVPLLDEPEPPLPTPAGGGLVNVNSASLEELQSLPGIGPVTAQAIIDFREANGPFADLSALDAVQGIGPATLERLAEHVAFE